MVNSDSTISNQTPKWLLVLGLVVAIAASGFMGIYTSQAAADPYSREVLTLVGDQVQGNAIFQINCAGCHGIEGNSADDSFPKLAGQYDDYIQQTLLDYQSGKRNNAIMTGIAAALSKQDIKDLSHWFRSQESDLTAPVIESVM